MFTAFSYTNMKGYIRTVANSVMFVNMHFQCFYSAHFPSLYVLSSNT